MVSSRIHGTLKGSLNDHGLCCGCHDKRNVECVDGTWVHICIAKETAQYATPA